MEYLLNNFFANDMIKFMFKSEIFKKSLETSLKKENWGWPWIFSRYLKRTSKNIGYRFIKIQHFGSFNSFEHTKWQKSFLFMNYENFLSISSPDFPPKLIVNFAGFIHIPYWQTTYSEKR